MGVTLDTIRIHPCATLKGDTWRCLCGHELDVPKESPFAPTQDQISAAWSEHLAERINTKLRANKLLVEES